MLMAVQGCLRFALAAGVGVECVWHAAFSTAMALKGYVAVPGTFWRCIAVQAGLHAAFGTVMALLHRHRVKDAAVGGSAATGPLGQVR